MRDTRHVNARVLRSLVVLVPLVGVLAACGDDVSQPVANRSDAITTEVPPTVVPPTDIPPTDAPTVPTTAAPETTAAPTVPTTAAPTTTAAPAGWTRTGPMPGLAYPACCASNYVGEPSPPIPSDPSAPLAPGVYHAFRPLPAAGTAFDPTTIDFELSAFVPCGTPDVFCEEGFVDGEVGVGPVGRQVAMPLDDSVRVVVGGFACPDDSNWTTDHQAATGTLFAALQAQYEAAYAGEVAPIVAETSWDDWALVFAEPRAGFSPACQMAGLLQWQGSAGPGILLQSVGQYDDATETVQPFVSVSASTIWLTAMEVGADGGRTLYFYASFLS